MMQDLTGQTFYGCCAIPQLLTTAYAVVLITLRILLKILLITIKKDVMDDQHT